MFALAGQTKPLEGIDASMNPGQLVAAATQAGAFSIVGGVWIDEDAVRTKASSDKASWVTAHEKLSPLAEVDPTDGSAVAGKKTELLAAIEAVEPLVENYAGARGAELKEVWRSSSWRWIRPTPTGTAHERSARGLRRPSGR